MSASAVGALLNNIPTVWAVPLAGYLGAVTYETATFCNSDPPGIPTITALDVAQMLLVGQPLLQAPALAKLAQLVEHFVWCQICQCDNGTIPNCGTGPAAPTGMPSINPPQVGGGYASGQACGEFDLDTSFSCSSGSTSQGPFGLPSGATYYSIDQSNVTTATSGGGGVTVSFQNSSGSNVLVTGTFIGSTINTPHVEGSIPSTAVRYFVDYGISGTLLPCPMPFTSQVKIFCGTTPGGTGGIAPIPCPPDPIIQAMLDNILGLVTLIQRQSVPFAYIASTAHAGLSGEGHLSVQGLIGCKILLTTLPSNVGIENGDPLSYWEAGWIRWGNADGYSEKIPISASPQVSLPAEAGQYTRIGYTLSSGVVATITELVREA